MPTKLDNFVHWVGTIPAYVKLLNHPSNHEEADSLMVLLVAHAAQHDYHQILVHTTVDTDVVVLAVIVALQQHWHRS